MKGYTAITGWVADVSAAVLADLYLRAGAIPAGPPSKTTIWRVLTGLPPIMALVSVLTMAEATRGDISRRRDAR